MEGSQDYDAVEKGESPRSNNSQDPRDLRRKLGLDSSALLCSAYFATLDFRKFACYENICR